MSGKKTKVYFNKVIINVGSEKAKKGHIPGPHEMMKILDAMEQSLSSNNGHSQEESITDKALAVKEKVAGAIERANKRGAKEIAAAYQEIMNDVDVILSKSNVIQFKLRKVEEMIMQTRRQPGQKEEEGAKQGDNLSN